MKRVLFALACILTAITPLSVSAETSEIKLEITAPLEPWSTETIDFELDIPLIAITEISLHLEGTSQDQLYHCESPADVRFTAGRMELHIGDSVLDAPYASVVHSFERSAGSQPFVSSDILLSENPNDWLFLTDGIGQIGIANKPYTGIYKDKLPFPCSPVIVPFTITSATLVVTYDPAVPVEKTTWSTLKQYYH